MAKLYNTPTGPKYPIQDVRINRKSAELIGHCLHLTPKREAELDNLLGIPVHIPSRAETIAANSPDEAIVEVEDWMNVGPSPDELLAIEQEEIDFLR